MFMLTPLLLMVMVYQVLNSGDLQQCFEKKVSCMKDLNCNQVCQDNGFKKGKCQKQNLDECPVDQPWRCMCYGEKNGDWTPLSGFLNGTKSYKQLSAKCATIYEHSNYQGSSLNIMSGEPINLKSHGWNNRISSLTVEDGCVLTAYLNGNYDGYSVDYSANQDTLPWWFNDHFSSLKCDCTKGDCKCGLAKRKSRIVGGQVTEVNEYPWQVGIVWKNDNFVWCGASLISNRWILSAAHCVCSNHAKYIQVLLGEHDYSSSSETTEVRMDIEQIIEHYVYNPKTQDYDFNLLKMRNKINFADYPHIRPICLPEDNSKDYTDVVATVTGWGRTSFGGPESNKLREVDVKVITNNECNNDYSITDRMLCAEAEGGNGGKDSCQGDSGGPLVTSNPGDGVTPGQNYELIGVVSFGRNCAKYPGVYARVTSVLSWIKRNGDVLGNTCPRS